MESKKISFGFSKIERNLNLLPLNKSKEILKPSIELIKCLEGQEIKLVEEKKVEAPMVIPLKENTKTSAALASLIKRRAVLLGEVDESPPDQPGRKGDSDTTSTTNGKAINESLEERAARELLDSVQNNDNEPIDQNLILPALKADELPLDGAKQSSIDDYEDVPIEQFGKAMLRGMGWVEPIQKKKGQPEDEMPFIRPKGMGLGADKALKKQPLLIAPEKNEVLEIRKQAFVRILGGKHKDMYGQIEGFDDHAGRVIVKMAIGGNKEAFNEFLCQPISKKEYGQYGKCINTAKYEEYKKMQNEHGQIIIKNEETDKEKSLFKGEKKNKVEYKKEYDNSKFENNESDKRFESRKHDDDSQRSAPQSSARRQGTDYQRSFSSNGARDEDGRRHVEHRSSKMRRQALDEKHKSSSRREHYDEHRNERDQSKRGSRERSNRTDHEKRVPSASGSSSRRQYTDDTSVSSGTDSDSDSAYERKAKKKSSHKSKVKKKSSKKSKRKHRQRPTDAEPSCSSDSEEDEDSCRWEKKQHKKKTKKSKKPRSRSRSHDRRSRR